MFAKTLDVRFEKLDPEHGFDAKWKRLSIAFVQIVPQTHHIFVCKFPVVCAKMLDHIAEFVDFFVHAQEAGEKSKCNRFAWEKTAKKH